MDPISLAIAGIGLGTKLLGGILGSGDQSKYSGEISNLSSQNAQIEGKNAELETQVNNQRQSQMELTARRQELEDFRVSQRARAKGVNAAVNQGAQFGSGLQGGEASVTNQGLFNVLGVKQNLQIGENIFGYEDNVSQNNVSISRNNAQISSLKGQMNSALSTDNMISSIGSNIAGSTNVLSGLVKDIGSAASTAMNPLAGAFSF